MRASKRISTKFGTNQPWVKRIKNCPIEGPGEVLVQGHNIITKMQKWGEVIEKFSP
jgi:hypothetical protein